MGVSSRILALTFVLGFAPSVRAQVHEARAQITSDDARAPEVYARPALATDQEWVFVCEASCEHRFALGRYDLALGVDGSDPHPILGRATSIEYDLRLRVRFDDRAGQRTAGAVLLGVGGVFVGSGVGLVAVAATGGAGVAELVAWGYLFSVAFFVAGAALLITGIVLAALGDRAMVFVLPWDAQPPGPTFMN